MVHEPIEERRFGTAVRWWSGAGTNLLNTVRLCVFCWSVEEDFMRRTRYSVAMILDGSVAGPKGDFDWIKIDPDLDLTAMFEQLDSIVAGRRRFEPMVPRGGN